MKLNAIALALALAAPALAPAASANLESSARSLIARRGIEELSAANARRSIRGAKAVWTELSVAKPGKAAAFDNLVSDLQTTELEGQLRAAGFRLMDPKKRSLAIGLRPTVALSVHFVAKGGEGNDTDFYLVTVKAMQDVTPLGGEKMSMTTWLYCGEPIASLGDIHADIDAIRISARAGVKAFIDTAKDEDVTPVEKRP